MKPGYVYIMASKKEGVVYIGVTSNLVQRVQEHRLGMREGFTKRYQVKRLVYYEAFDEIGLAIEREKKLKNWHRDWKINLISRHNPDWNDLYDVIVL